MKNYKGGVLLTTLLFLLLFSFLFSYILEEFRTSQLFYKNSQDFYTAKIMSSLFLTNIRQETSKIKTSGTVSYSTGRLFYEYTNHQIVMHVRVNQKVYKFQRTFQETKDDSAAHKKW